MRSITSSTAAPCLRLRKARLMVSPRPKIRCAAATSITAELLVTPWPVSNTPTTRNRFLPASSTTSPGERPSRRAEARPTTTSSVPGRGNRPATSRAARISAWPVSTPKTSTCERSGSWLAPIVTTDTSRTSGRARNAATSAGPTCESSGSDAPACCTSTSLPRPATIVRRSSLSPWPEATSTTYDAAPNATPALVRMERSGRRTTLRKPIATRPVTSV